MKIFLRLTVIIAVFMAGFAAGFPAGKSSGFMSGAEWSSIQANIHAREAGVFMPVRYESGEFRVTMRKPKRVYSQAKLQADQYEEESMRANNESRSLSERAQLVRTISLTQ